MNKLELIGRAKLKLLSRCRIWHGPTFWSPATLRGTLSSDSWVSFPGGQKAGGNCASLRYLTRTTQTLTTQCSLTSVSTQPWWPPADPCYRYGRHPISQCTSFLPRTKVYMESLRIWSKMYVYFLLVPRKGIWPQNCRSKKCQIHPIPTDTMCKKWSFQRGCLHNSGPEFPPGHVLSGETLWPAKWKRSHLSVIAVSSASKISEFVSL